MTSYMPAGSQVTQSRESAPLDLHWSLPGGPCPLPVQTIRPPRGPRRVVLPPLLDPAAWLTPIPPLARGGEGGVAVGPVPDGPFDFTAQMRRLCADIAGRCEFFRHLDVTRILFGVTQARNGRAHGLQAKVIPLRFADGELRRRRGRRLYQVQRYWLDTVEILYTITFCLPRFLDQSFEEKFITIFHELYHLGPQFNGDLRRHEGRYCLHTHSQKGYDQLMAALVREYLHGHPDAALYSFLRHNFHSLEQQHGAVQGTMIPVPKLIPIHEDDG